MNSIFNNEKLCSKIRGFIQVGASIGEEIPEWIKLKIPNQIFIEPINNLFPILERNAHNQPHHPDVKCFNIALTDHDGQDDFHISTDSFCSSSLLDFDKDAVRYGTTLQTSELRKVEVRKLDTLVKEQNLDLSKYNLLYIDVQGSEYYVMKGAEESLKYFEIIFVEVNNITIYSGSVLWADFKRYMLSKGFALIDVRPLEGSQGCQSEALFFNKSFKWS